METGIKTKKVNYLVMSNKVCTECGHPIKQNVINRTPQVKLCYVCFKLSEGKRYFFEHGIRKDRLELKKSNIKKHKPLSKAK